jgi:CO/xanthine dehydrogenase Mo-binding subunit/CO/xanthine dehydrogenase FAD-binding subunit
MSLLAPTPPDFTLSPHTRPADAQRATDAAGNSAVFAGGATALQLAWTAGTAPAPQTLIPVAACAGSQGIRLEGPWLRLGAADSLERVRSHALVRAHAPLLVAACERIGSLALRRLGTLGGNIGWRFGDAVSALLALEAQALDATDRWHALSELLTLPRLPLLVALRVRSEAAADWRYEKLGGRLAFSPTRLSLAMACLGAASLDDTPGPAEGSSPRADGPRWRMAAGGAGLPVRRLWRVESLLADSPGALPDPTRLREACLADLDGDSARARVAARLLAGHLAHPNGPPPARLPTSASARDDGITAGVHERSAAAGPLVDRLRPRADSAERLGGNPGYHTDHFPAGLLHAALVGSPHPHARIVSIDTLEAAAMPGVRTVVTVADFAADPRYGLRVVDRPALCQDRVRCVGDPVAAVAAETLAQARAAAAAVRVQYETLPTLDDPEAALAPNAVAIHPGGNLLHACALHRGDPAAARAATVHWVESVCHTPRQMPAFLETEGGTVEPDGAGGLRVRFGGQNPERDRQEIARLLGLDPARVRVSATPVGGSFGGKDELTVQPIAALLAWRAGQAVRLQLSRPESVDLGVKRHPMRIRMRSGCDAEGRLTLHEVDVLADTGAYATHGPEVLDAAREHAVGPYRWQAVNVAARLAYTNNGIAGAMRGFGAVQVQIALEQQLDRLAAAAGLDPLSLRARNLTGPHDPGPLGQQIAPFDGARLALAAAAAHPLWQGPRQQADRRYRRAVGLALVHRSDGYGRGGPNGGRLAFALGPDGRHEVRVSFTEMGQGLGEAVRAMAAEAFGCAPEAVRPVLGDSALAPDTGAVAASRASTMIHRALREHAPAFRQQVAAWRAAGATGAPPVQLIDLPGEETPSDIASAHLVFGACAALAEVCVDTWSGQLRVTRMVLFPALGPVISPAGYLGQMEGGALMGQGMVTLEDLPAVQGRYPARNLDDYLVPTLLDAPELAVFPIETVPADDRIGPRGAGEIGVNIGAVVCAAAITAAIGRAPERWPADPAQVLDLLEDAP